MDATPFIVVTRLLVLAVVAASVLALIVSATRGGMPRRERVLRVGLALLVGVSISPTFVPTLADALPLSLAGFLLIALVFATYPDGRFVPRWTIGIVVAWIPVVVVAVATGGRLLDQPWWWLVPTTTGLALLGAQLHRYMRRSTSAEREATRWAILGLASSMLLFLVLSFLGEIGTPGTEAEAWASLAGIPFVVGPVVGLVRPQVWNVDAAFRGFLTATFAALPLAVVFAAVSFVASLAGVGATAAGWWGAAAVAASAYPLVRLGSRLATAIVYRGRGDAATAVARLAERLDDLPDPRAVSETVARSVADAVRVDAVELRGDVFAAVIGEPAGPDDAAEEFPVAFHGDVLATLTVRPRPGEGSLTPYDRALIKRLALHAAPALHGARALAELTATHARLLLAREEERRRLRRDLHDDLSPTLSGLGLSATALARRAGTFDDALAETARDLAADIKDAVAQTREIAYGLRPPILDDRGLVAAIRDRVHGAAADRVQVDIVAPDEPLVLPAAVDLAALRIVQEAVANVRRHADAHLCTVTLRRGVGELVVLVDDDGRGIPDRVHPGIGLTSIRDRASELGGTATFARSAAGGTRVRVRLPVDDAPAAHEDAARKEVA